MWKKIEYICPHCGYEIHSKTNFCLNCGKKIEINEEIEEDKDPSDVENKDNETKLICAYCHTENDSLAIYCEGCGRRLIDEEENTNSDEVASNNLDDEEEPESISEASEEKEISEEENNLEDIDRIEESSDIEENPDDSETLESTSSEEIVDEDTADNLDDEEEYVRVCGYCETENSLSAIYCEGCGRRLIDEEENTNSDEVASNNLDDEEEPESISEASEEKEISEEENNLEDIDRIEESSDIEENPDDSETLESTSSEEIVDEDTADNLDDEEEYVRVCGYCETENSLSAIYCEGCGRRLIDEEELESISGASGENEISEEENNLEDTDRIEESSDIEDDSDESKTLEPTSSEEIEENTSNDSDGEEDDTDLEEDGMDEAHEDAIEEPESETNTFEENEISEEANNLEDIDRIEESSDIEDDSDESEIEEEKVSKTDAKEGLEKQEESDSKVNVETNLEKKTSAILSSGEVRTSLVSNKNKRKKKIVIVLILLLLIISIGCYLFFCTDIFSPHNNNPVEEKENILIKVPSVVGEEVDKATKILEDLSLKVKIEEVTTENSEEIGKIFEQDIIDKEVEEDTLITLKSYVSTEKVIVESVIDFKVEDAVKKLEELGLKVVVKETYSDKEKSIVTSQSKNPGEEVAKGSVIEITISKGQKPDENESLLEEENDNHQNTSSGNDGNKENSENNEKPSIPVNGNDTESTINKWFDSVDALPSEVNQNNYDIEEKTVYRYRTIETTKSDQPSLPGWNLAFQSSVMTGWSDIQRISDVSEEQLANYRNNSQYQIVSEEVSYYRIDGIHCDKISGERGSVLPSSDGTCPSGYQLHASWTVSPTDLSGIGVTLANCDRHNMILQNQITKSSPIWLLKVRTAVMKYTYHYTRTTDWSAWQDEKIESGSNREVETKKMYRYKEK